MQRTFVFYDPTGRRWTRFRRIVGIAGIAAVALLVVLALAIISNPILPALGLPSVQHLANFGELGTITTMDASGFRDDTLPRMMDCA